MSVISTAILVFVIVALAYTYWRLIGSLVKTLQIPRFPLILIILLFLGLSGGLIYILSHLLLADTINAGTLLGMLFGITLIIGTISTFLAKKK